MQVIPAIDLRGGCCVRLRQGDYGAISNALDQLGKAVQDTADKVVPQQDLSNSFPNQSGQQGQPGQTAHITIVSPHRRNINAGIRLGF